MEYGNIGIAVAGLKYGTESRVMSRVAAEDLALGLPLFQLKGETDSIALLNNDTAEITYDAVMVTGNNVNVTIVRPGPLGDLVTTSVDQAFDTDSATTLTALIAQLTAVYGIVAVTGGALIIDLNSDDGAAIVVTSVVTGGASQAGATIVSANSGNQVFRGVSMLTQNNPVPYESGDMVNIMTNGRIYVQCSTACVAGNGVFYAADGTFANAGTAIPGMLFESNLNAAGLALVVINQP